MSTAEMSGGRRALLIASGSYTDPGLNSLRSPVGDVRKLGAVLGDPMIGAFEVREVLDRPTAEILQAIEQFFADARRADVLLLYLSGHGVIARDGGLYFATASTDLTVLRSTAIADSFVAGSMRHSRSRSIVLMLDCCHSGAFGKGLTPKGALEVDVEHRFKGSGHVTLTASSAIEYAFEEESIEDLGAAKAGSLFTRFIVDGLWTGDADDDEDGNISVDELYSYVYDRVQSLAPQQRPGKSGTGHGELVIARSPRRTSLSPELRQALKSPFAGVRLAAVAELTPLWREREEDDAAVEAALRERLDDSDATVAAAARAVLEGTEERTEAEAPGPAKPEADVEVTVDAVTEGDVDVAAATEDDLKVAASTDDHVKTEALTDGEPRVVHPAADPPAAPTQRPTVPLRPSMPSPAAQSPAGSLRRWAVVIATLAIAAVIAVVLASGGEKPIGTAIPVGSNPSDVAVGEGAVWVTNFKAGTVSSVVPASGRLAGSATPVQGEPVAVAAVVSSQNANRAWVVTNEPGGVTAIDAATRKVIGTPIRFGGYPTDVAVSDDAVWVTTDHAIARIDPSTRKIVKRIRLPGERTPEAVAVDRRRGGDAVWVIAGDGLYRIDADSNRLAGTGSTRALAHVTDARAIAVGGGAVWVVNGGEDHGALTKLDRDTGEIAGDPIVVDDEEVQDVAVGEGAVWVAGSRLTRVDPTTGRIISRPFLTNEPGVAVSVGSSSVWVAMGDEDVVRRIDPAA